MHPPAGSCNPGTGMFRDHAPAARSRRRDTSRRRRPRYKGCPPVGDQRRHPGLAGESLRGMHRQRWAALDLRSAGIGMHVDHHVELFAG
ncbi:MAG: hypothetical protein ACRDTA_24595 [Pseudonocardiaceae bacterium]